MNTNNLIEYLKSCSGEELSEILNHVLQERPENENSNGVISRLIFCEAFKMVKDDGSIPNSWEFTPIGFHDSSEYQRGFGGEPYLQTGFCGTCQLEICSHAKKAICPLCKNIVYCT